MPPLTGLEHSPLASAAVGDSIFRQKKNTYFAKKPAQTDNRMMKENLLPLLKRRIAQIAIGPSTARGMGPKGTIQDARTFLTKIDLREVSRLRVEQFSRFLDRETEKLERALPRRPQRWGPARKFLNIFLRDTLYARWLCEGWPIDHLEESLEIPLDKHVAFRLKSEPDGKDLPPWKTVIDLNHEASDQFQAVALKVARGKGFARVHLDLEYWRSEAALNGLTPSTPR